MQDRPDTNSADSVALIALGGVPWGRSWKRNQSMVFQLSRRPLIERVLFVNPRAVWVKDDLAARNGSFTQRAGRLVGSVPRRYDAKICILSMMHFVPLKSRMGVGRKLEEAVFRATLRFLRGRKNYILLNNHPNFFSRDLLVELMDHATLSVFDLSDDFVEYHRDPLHREVIGESIRFSCSRSDVVLAVNEHVAKKYGVYNPSTYAIPNSTNFENFHRSEYRPVAFLERIKAKGRPIVGYTGIINSVRMDFALLREILAAKPDWEFVFIGSAEPSFFELASSFENLHHHPQVDYDVLADCVRYFDVTMVPFQVNEHTRGNDLLKYNDYLATGKQIVTTDMGGAQRYGDLLRVAHSAAEFVAQLEAAVREDDAERRARGIEYARKHSWNHKACEIEELLRQHMLARKTA